MRSIMRDFRDAPAAWGGVLLVLIVAQSELGMLAMMLSSANELKHRPSMAVAGNTTYQNLMIPFVALVVATVLVLSQVVSSLITQRRRNLALLALQGATPWQLTRLMCLRVLTLTVVATVLACIISVPLTHPLYAWETSQFVVGEQPFLADHAIIAWMIGEVCGFAVAMIGTLITIRAANRVAPVEALRVATNPPRTVGVVRRVLAITIAIIAILIMVLPVIEARRIDHDELVKLDSAEPILPISAASTIGFILLLVSMCLFGPLLFGWTTTVWTSIVALPCASWRIACEQATARARNLSAVLIPLTVGISLVMMMDSFYVTGEASSHLLPPNLNVESSNFSMILTLLGPALAVVLAGICAGYLILAHSRSLDLALISITGAEPRQLHLMAGFEGVIAVTTATLLSFLSSLVPLIIFVAGFHRVFGVARLGIPWAQWGLIYGLLIVAATLASWLTVRPSLHASPAGVISRYTGE